MGHFLGVKNRFLEASLVCCLYLLNLDSCFSLNGEGVALLRFKERVISDPYGALSNWIDEIGVQTPCSWFGIHCSKGHVVALKLEDMCLRGTLPPEIGKLIHLKFVILRNNSFSGVIPEEFVNLKQLQVLDLRYNNFSQHVSVHLRNYFSSTIALLDNKSELRTLSEVNELVTSPNSGKNRRKLSMGRWWYIPILSESVSTSVRASVSEPSPSPPPPASVSSRHNYRPLIVSAAVGGPVLLVFIFGIYFWRSGKVSTVKPWATGLSGQLQRAFVTGVPKLKRSELDAACEDFSNVIGSVSLCTLYKGTLSSGVEIAVASIAVATKKEWSKNMEAQFRNKVETLSKVNHKNFASLLGYCVEEKPFTRMMVFEYAPNGTLFEHLHIREAGHLDWPTRTRVAAGIAYCLDYMHQINPPFIHRNFKSSSVCLTEDYAAKISDFGFFDERFAKPEMLPNTNDNVYAFGVVLYEMVTGKLPYIAGSDSPTNWASDYLSGTQFLREVVDPTLESYVEDQVEELGHVIRACTDQNPRFRPSMREVCEKLREITGIKPEAAVPRLSPLWWAELEIESNDIE